MVANLPKPILGDITAFTINTPDPERSLIYYRRLGFHELMRSDWPFPFILISDDAIQMMLRKDPNPYIALSYYVRDAGAVASMLAEKGIVFKETPKPTDPLQRYLIQSPDGLNVSLVGVPDGFTQPAGPTMLQMQQQDYFNPDKYTNKVSGMFGEFAHPVKDLDATIAFWDKLGFKAVSRFTSPYPWAILSDGLSVVGAHQTEHFSFPAITFFAADMKEKLASLKDAGLTDYIEKGPANAVLTTPEQQHIFLYKLGM
jgi:catechol 2,3-dioxygenase-like lactoylglutathione lyase family enzyme